MTQPPIDHVEQVDLTLEMQRSYLDYAMSVIVGRALPDVRDGLKPVHRRVLYAMYDGGYRPDAAFSKCSRVVGEVMGQYHPHGDASIYDALVRLVQPWSMRYPLVAGQGNFGSAGNLGAAAPRYTECKLAPLAMEMVRDIDQETVDFQDNYDGRNQEPMVLPARFPNLLVNGSEGIAVGMATRIPPHNLREVAEGVQWFLDNPDATREELLEALMVRIKGPDFPTGATILGRRGIEEAYRTGRGSITQRAVVNVEEIQGRQCLVVTELPYQVNPDNLVTKIAQLVNDGRIQGIADMRDESSGRAGQRLVIVLKRDAVPKVVLNNLYKHTQLQDNFPANMLALVDGVPRTLSLDGFVRHWVTHQIDVVVRRTRFLLKRAEERIHILRGQLKALDMLDEVIALIRASESGDTARVGLMELLDIDEVQADAILAMQLRRLAALERQKIVDELAELEERIADLKDILAKPERQRAIVRDELAEVVEKFGDDRRTEIIGAVGDVTEEDLIARENVVVTITSTGYAKRTKVDAYKSQRRGGKGVRGADLKQDDIIRHFFVCSTHDWILFFTNRGRVYRLKAYELPEATRAARGQHVANLLEFQPGERIAEVLQIQTYQDSPYLVLATHEGKVKKSRLEEYDSARSSGLIAINLKEGDSLIGARLCSEEDDLLLVSERGQAIRFIASDDALRPMGRATAGVLGMRFKGDDKLLSMVVIEDDDQHLLVATTGGYGKKTPLREYTAQNRGGQGVLTLKYDPKRGAIMGALVVTNEDEIFAVTSAGDIIRTPVNQIRATSRATKGVRLVNLADGVELLAIDRNVEDEGEETAVKVSESGTLDVVEARAGGVSAADTADSGDKGGEE